MKSEYIERWKMRYEIHFNGRAWVYAQDKNEAIEILKDDLEDIVNSINIQEVKEMEEK